MDIDAECESTCSVVNSTVCIIHKDTDMDMNMEYGSTWSVETLYIT